MAAEKDNRPALLSSVDWRELIYRGVESQTLDYKAAQDWNALPRVGKAKFARHAMAMANTKGGYIVVGVGEDENGNPTRYTGLTESQLRSFDPSTVGQFVNLFADPGIDFDIVRPEVDGRYYAVFAIRRFGGLPHVCADHCGDELQQGVFYTRTPDARSRSAYRASELHGLVQRALRNQREVLGRMLRGVLYEGRQYPEADAEQEFSRLLQGSKEECRKWIGPRRLQRFCCFELAVYPPEIFSEGVDLSDLKRAVDSVALPVMSDFPLAGQAAGEIFFTNHSLTCRHLREVGEEFAGRFHFWHFFQLGLFHHLSSLVDLEPDRRVPYELLVNRVGSAIEAVGELYSELGCEDEILTFTVTLTNVEGVWLDLSDRATAESEDRPVCYIPEIVVRKRRSVADLVSDPVEHAVRVVREVCERFNLSADRHPDLRRRLDRLLG